MCEIIKLNPARPRSFNSFILLAKELILSAYKNILNNEDLEEITNYINIKSLRKAYANNNEYFLIKNDKEDVGFFQTKQIEDSLDITRIYIKKPYQNQKFGYNAFLRTIELAKKKKLKKIIIYINKKFKKAQKAISKWGFEKKELTVRYIGSENYMYEYYYEFEL